MSTIAAEIARRLSLAQCRALRAMSDKQIHAIGLPTMTALVGQNLVEAVEGAPALTRLGRDVVDEIRILRRS